jgi:hypothetical protein
MGSDNGLLRAAMPWAAESSPAKPGFLVAAAAGLLIVILGTVLMVVTVRRSGPARRRSLSSRAIGAIRN